MPTKAIITILCLCALPVAASEYPAFDQAGNAYPVECRRDLSDIKALVVPVDGFPHQRQLAQYVPSIGGKNDIILVSRRLGGWKYDDAVHHERCHALILKLHPETGGQWHR